MSSESMAFIAGIVLGASMAVIVSGGVAQNYWQNELIRRGHAEYNQQTGAWQWKEQKR